MTSGPMDIVKSETPHVGENAQVEHQASEGGGEPKRAIALLSGGLDSATATAQAIADGATSQGEPLGFDLERFKRWYHQAGTPELSIDRQWNPESGQLTVDLHQATPPTPGQADKQPLVLPVAMALVGEQGRVGEEQLLVMEAERASITLQGQPGGRPAGPGRKRTDDRQRVADAGPDRQQLIVLLTDQVGLPADADAGRTRFQQHIIGPGHAVFQY